MGFIVAMLPVEFLTTVIIAVIIRFIPGTIFIMVVVTLIPVVDRTISILWSSMPGAMVFLWMMVFTTMVIPWSIVAITAVIFWMVVFLVCILFPLLSFPMVLFFATVITMISVTRVDMMWGIIDVLLWRRFRTKFEGTMWMDGER